MSTIRMDALIDESIAESFPASDPPSFMAGAAVAGSPPRAGIVREPASTELRSASLERVADRFERTREGAYFLWENDGRPDGRAQDHWLRAERDLATGHSRRPT